MIILDTDAVTFLEHRASAVSSLLRQRLTTLSAEHPIVTTIITYEEQTRGWIAMFAKARDASSIIDAYSDLLQHVETFKNVDMVPYTNHAHTHFVELQRQKIRIGTRDLRIAAIALANDALLLSRNLRDFQKVPNLRVEDWTKS
jgi:tRNA(fMet)-specific endonuclease VapC